ncbi:MAG: Type 1 glutamine amidotransferase-like domain-containing protein [Clostridia bacterium]|nr:Type 1 glutamine amidotransferase-like domain-containing protein [Clostridia bacterium]
MDRYIIAVGGGEIKEKQTLKIDEYICDLAKKRAGQNRAVALFLGTASHDHMPYYNSFHKTYTGVFGLKTDCALIVDREIDYEKIRGKFNSADLIYVGGGDTLFMIDQWKKSGIFDMIIGAYNRGVILCGLSAGAICWFENMYTDSRIIQGKSNSYFFEKGIGLLRGSACPHYEVRRNDLLCNDLNLLPSPVLCIESLSAVVFKNEEIEGQITCGGNSFIITDNKSEKVLKSIIK